MFKLLRKVQRLLLCKLHTCTKTRLNAVTVSSVNGGDATMQAEKHNEETIHYTVHTLCAGHKGKQNQHATCSPTPYSHWKEKCSFSKTLSITCWFERFCFGSCVEIYSRCCFCFMGIMCVRGRKCCLSYYPVVVSDREASTNPL